MFFSGSKAAYSPACTLSLILYGLARRIAVRFHWCHSSICQADAFGVELRKLPVRACHEINTCQGEKEEPLISDQTGAFQPVAHKTYTQLKFTQTLLPSSSKEKCQKTAEMLHQLKYYIYAWFKKPKMYSHSYFSIRDL